MPFAVNERSEYCCVGGVVAGTESSVSYRMSSGLPPGCLGWLVSEILQASSS